MMDAEALAGLMKVICTVWVYDIVILERTLQELLHYTIDVVQLS